MKTSLLEKYSKTHFVCNFVSCYLKKLKSRGIKLSNDIYVSLHHSFGTDKPLYVTNYIL